MSAPWIGLIGSLVGGTLWNIIQDRGYELTWGGFLASLLGSILFLLVVGVLRKTPTSKLDETER